MSSERREAIDPDGRQVILDERTIRHLYSRRPQMVGHTASILDAVMRLASVTKEMEGLVTRATGYTESGIEKARAAAEQLAESRA